MAECSSGPSKMPPPRGTNQPSGSAFKQQRLATWQPILSPANVLPVFFLLGVAFVALGVGLLRFSDDIKERELDYTDCLAHPQPVEANGTAVTCAELIRRSSGECRVCRCRIRFFLDANFKGDVDMYYGLTNFYQNHRLYMKSRDDLQLGGDLDDKPSSDCTPFIHDNTTKKPIAPCGTIANSLFNDTFQLVYVSNGTEVPVPLNTSIAWPSDKSSKFHNEKDWLQKLKKYSHPPNWCRNLSELDPQNPSNNGMENEELIVWMRTAALPAFRKLHRRLNRTHLFKNGLPKGRYLLNINYSYPVKAFHGTKLFMLSTTSVLGNKNRFLGVSYIVVGCICLMLGFIFLVLHIKWGKCTIETSDLILQMPNQIHAPARG